MVLSIESSMSDMYLIIVPVPSEGSYILSLMLRREA
jgi:hypothetical protein